MSRFEFLRTRLGFAKPLLEAIASLESRIAERWVSAAYHRLFLVQWGIYPLPEFFEHKIGMFWGWGPTRQAYWVERGVRVFETIYSERTNLYFWASDGDLPFSPGWPHAAGN